MSSQNVFLRLTVLLFVLVMFSCNSDDTKKYSFVVDGKLSNSNNEWVMIYRLLPNGLEALDSVKLSNDGKFELKFKSIQSADLFLFSVQSLPYRITLFLRDGEHATIEADAQNIAQDYRVNGSEGSKKIMDLSLTVERFINQADSIYFAYRKISADSNSLDVRRITDSLLFDNYSKTYQFVKEFCIKNKNDLSGIIGLYTRYGEKLILDMEADFDVFEQVALANEKHSADNIHVADLLAFVNNYNFKRQHANEVENNLIAGKKIPELQLPSLDGKTISTLDFMGNYLILNFWSSKDAYSWDVNAKLKTYLEIYKNDSLNLLSVGLDRDKLTWANTIAIDNLKWNHVLANDAALSLFNLNQKNRLFLVDPKGVIIAKEPSLDSLDRLLIHYFKN